MDPIAEQISWWQDNGFMPWCAHEALYGHSPQIMTWPRLEERMRRDFGPDKETLELIAKLEREFVLVMIPATGAPRERQRL